MAKIITVKGVKLYPVCGFQKSQHKLYYWENYYYLKAHDDNATDKDLEQWILWQEICEYATCCVYDGLIYVPYKFYNIVKEAIVMYDIRH